jgi:Mg2+ and Co2+ transporter CorA
MSVNQPVKPDRRKNVREIVNLVFSDSFMIFLAVAMIPIVLLPILVSLPKSVEDMMTFADYTILGLFIVEYVLKTAFAENVIRHIIDPWHLLDLFIILVPLIGFIPAISHQFAYSSPLLRLLRIVRLVAVGGRAVDRRRQMVPEQSADTSPVLPAETRIMDGTLETIHYEVPFDKIEEFILSPTHTWVDISSISEKETNKLAEWLNIPRLILESELSNESFPRIDYFEHYSLIFARVASPEILVSGPGKLTIDRSGVLVICQGHNIITLSRSKANIFDLILADARKLNMPDEPPVVTILYSLLKYILERDQSIIRILEKEIMVLENIPLKKRPANFLETTFYLRKETNQLVPALLHLQEILNMIKSERVPLEGFTEKHQKIFDILVDEAEYLGETASNARDNLQSLVDLYINSSSFELNRVMRIVAVITSMAIIPTIILGALGSNLTGSPWDVSLWQVFIIVGITMSLLGWVFYRLGWLK